MLRLASANGRDADRRSERERRGTGERRRRTAPVAEDRRWVGDRRRGERRDGLAERLVRVYG